MSILDDLVQGAGTLAQVGFAIRQSQVEVSVQKDRAAAEKAKAEADLIATQTGQSVLYKFARYAFFAMAAIAAVAMLAEVKRLWKGR